MSFGKWYEEKKAEESNDIESGRESWLGEDVPLFNSETMQNFSWDNLKSSMEAQFPKKIMGMGYQQRFQVFCGLLIISAVFFALAFFVGLPMLAFHPHKFAISFTMGSLTFMSSFGILTGPKEHLKGLLQMDRITFTSIYVGSMIMTLYSTKISGVRGHVAVSLCSAIQIVALLWYLISFMPGGTAGLKYVMVAMGHVLRPVLTTCARIHGICIARCFGWMRTSSSS